MGIVARMGAVVALGLFVAASAWAQTAGGPPAATPVAPVPVAPVVAQAPTAGPVPATVPATTAKAPAPADATLRALEGRRVSVATGPGTVVTGKLLGFEADSITLATDDGTPVTVSRAQITTLRLAEITAGASAPLVTGPRVGPLPDNRLPDNRLPDNRQTDNEARASDAQPPSTGAPRYFGVHIGLAPGVAFDFDYGYFHAFASTSLLIPLVTDGRMFGFTIGAGPSFPLTARWRFDLFVHVAPMFWDQYGYGAVRWLDPYVGLGVGMGFHYTAPAGWVVGVALPLLGGVIMPSTGYDAVYARPSNASQVAGYYYLASAVSLAGFSFGYRF